MSDKEIRRELVRIVQRANSYRQARIEELLQDVAAEVTLLLCHGEQSIGKEERIAAFLYSHKFPFRGVYAAQVNGGVLALCVGSMAPPKVGLQSVVDVIASHLVALLANESRPTRDYEAA
jgi:hypothetical protein